MEEHTCYKQNINFSDGEAFKGEFEKIHFSTGMACCDEIEIEKRFPKF